MCNIRYAKQSFTDKTAISVAVKAANWETGVCFKAVTLTKPTYSKQISAEVESLTVSALLKIYLPQATTSTEYKGVSTDNCIYSSNNTLE